MSLVARDSSGGTAITTAVTSAIVDITSAAVGAWCYAWCSISTGSTTQTGIPSATGWTQVQATQTAGGTSGACYGLWRRQKQSGDTTFTFSWATTAGKGEFLWASYTGLNGTTPDEASAIALNDTTSRAAVPTPSATPLGPGRWALTFFGQRSTTAGVVPTAWTAGTGISDIVEQDNSAAASAPWLGSQIADTNGAVTIASHSYTATTNVAAQSHDGSAILYLIPASVSAVADVYTETLLQDSTPRAQLSDIYVEVLITVPVGDATGGLQRWPDPLWPTLLQIAASRLGTGAPAAVSTFQGTATLAGASSLTATATQLALSTLTGGGSLTATGTQLAGTTLAGASSLSDTATQGSSGGLSGAGALAVTAVELAPATLAGSSSLGATDVVEQAGTTLTGAGALSGTVVQPVVATLTGAGSLGTTDATQIAGVSLTGASSLFAGQSLSGQLNGTSSLSPTAVQLAPVTLAGVSQLATAAAVAARVTLAGLGTITATVVSGVSVDGTTAGPPGSWWDAGDPRSSWTADQPYSTQWDTADPRTAWSASETGSSWHAGQPS